MIWHVAEVWALIAVMFVVGCVAGAFSYGLIGRSRLATAQGVAADAVGDLIDSVKARIGMAPAWRPGRLRNLDRPAPVSSKPVATGAIALPPARAMAEEDISEPPPPSVLLPPALSAPAVHNELAGAGEDYGILEDADLSPDARATSAMRVGDDGIMPKRPPGLALPRGGAPDNLQRIKGIGRRNEALLNTLGIYHFGQIAAWTPAEIRWIGQYLSFPERIERDDWPGQATLLAMGNDTGFEKSADRRRRRRREQRQFAERMVSAAHVPHDELEGTDTDPYATGPEYLADEQGYEPAPEFSVAVADREGEIEDIEPADEDYYDAEFIDDADEDDARRDDGAVKRR